MTEHYKTIKFRLVQDEPNGVWSATIDTGNTDSDYYYGICIGNSFAEATRNLLDRMVEMEIGSSWKANGNSSIAELEKF